MLMVAGHQDNIINLMKKLKDLFIKKEKKLIPSAELLKGTWQEYKKYAFKFIELLIYGLIGSLPFLILIFVFFNALVKFEEGLIGFGVLGILTVLLLAAFVLMIIWNLRAQIGSIILLKENYQPSPQESFKKSNKYLVPFLGVSVLLTVLVFAWGLLFLLPALIFGIYYGFAQYIQVAEDKRPFSSIERSYDLVINYWWPVFGRFCLLVLIGSLVYGLLSIPFYWMSDNGWLFESYNLVMNLIWVLLSPFFTIYPYKVYKNLVEIKD